MTKPDEEDQLAERLDRLWTGFSPTISGIRSPVGEVVAHFRLRAILGSGAFGVVYLADDLKRGHPVALKFPRIEVLLDPEKRERFETESSLLKRLVHPGIVPIYESETEGPIPFISSKWCNGPDLATWMQRFPQQHNQAVPWEEVAEFVALIADAVHYAHQQGVSHRDLKPANIMMSSDSVHDSKIVGLKQYRPQITDFGLAKLFDPTMIDTRASLIIGTPIYMAPEQIDGRSTTPTSGQNIATSDVYSLGIILFELLTGQVPVQGTNYLKFPNNIEHSPKLELNRLRPGLPPSLQKICDACLKRDPNARYASAAAVADDLRRCQVGSQQGGGIKAYMILRLRKFFPGWGDSNRRCLAICLGPKEIDAIRTRPR